MTKPLQALMMVTLLAPTTGWGQQPITFNVAHTNPSGSFSLGLSVGEVDSGYLVFGLQHGDSTPQDLHTYLFDSNGQLLQVRGFHHPRMQWIGNADPVARLSGSGFACGVSHFSGGLATSELHLYRFDEEGDTLWTRFLMTDTTVAIRMIAETSNGDLVLTGLYEFPRGAFIYRVTSSGDSVVFRNLGSPAFDALAVAEDGSGALYITGFGQEVATGHLNDAFLVKTDSIGNLIWRRHWPRESAFHRAIPAIDGGVVAIGAYAAPIPVWPQFEHGRALIAKYSTDGDLLWQHYPIQADEHLRPCIFLDGIEQADGSLVVCGMYKSTGTRDCGMLFKFTAEGEELWRRFYRYYDGQTLGNPQAFYAVEPTSDGGFILTGSAERTYDASYTHPAKLWLVKLDSMGCLVPGCHTVGIEEQALDLNEYLRIWPNPVARGTPLQLSFSPPQEFTPNGPLRVVVQDAQGRTVQEETVPSGVSTFSFPSSLLASGLYYLHLTDNTRWLAGGKVVVE